MRKSAAQRLRGDVDQLDLRRTTHYRVRNRLLLNHAGDVRDNVVEAFEVLHVDRGQNVDPGFEQFLYVLPALVILAPWRVGMCQLVHQDKGRTPSQHGLDVQFRHPCSAIIHQLGRHCFEVSDLRRGAGAAVCLHDGRDHVTATISTPMSLTEHREGLSDARRSAEVDTQFTTFACPTERLTDLLRRTHVTIIHQSSVQHT